MTHARVLHVEATVTPGAKVEFVERRPDGSYRIAVKARAEQGRATERAHELIAEEFGVARSRVRLVTGKRSRRKLFAIDPR